MCLFLVENEGNIDIITLHGHGTLSCLHFFPIVINFPLDVSTHARYM